MQTEIALRSSSYPSRLPREHVDEEDLPGKDAGLIDSQVKPMIAIDFQGKILQVTPVAAMLLKGDARRMTGAPITAIFPALRKSLEAIAQPNFTTIAHRLDGSQLPVQMSAMRVETDALKGWLILLQARKAPTLDSALAHLDGTLPTPFTLP
jgi:hypothetical protein